MDVLSVIKLLPESNEQVVKFSNELKDTLDSGEVNPLDVLLCIKGFEKVIKNIKENLNDICASLQYTIIGILLDTIKLVIVDLFKFIYT